MKSRAPCAVLSASIGSFLGCVPSGRGEPKQEAEAGNHSPSSSGRGARRRALMRRRRSRRQRQPPRRDARPEEPAELKRSANRQLSHVGDDMPPARRLGYRRWEGEGRRRPAAGKPVLMSLFPSLSLAAPCPAVPATQSPRTAPASRRISPQTATAAATNSTSQLPPRLSGGTERREVADRRHAGALASACQWPRPRPPHAFQPMGKEGSLLFSSPPSSLCC